MNELQIFDNSEFGKIRTMEQDGKILFCGKDVAKALGYTDVSKAIKQHCQKDGWAFYPLIDKVGREQQARFINEGNLYRLITHSKLESAEKFERWVFDEVLPTIRKTGSYGAPTITNENIGMIGAIVAEVFKQVIPAMGEMIQTIVRDERGFSSKTASVPSDLYVKRQSTVSNEIFVKRPVDVPRITQCKIESFPEHIITEVNSLFEEMQKQQALNFSMISRFCTVNGFPVSSVAAKRYFCKHFTI